MTSSVGRVYVVACSLLVFFVLWAFVAAHPWATAAPDARLAALDARQQRLGAQLAQAQAELVSSWASYRAADAKRKTAVSTAASATPVVRVVQLPPLATTRTS